MTPYIFLSFLGSAVVLGAAFVIGGFEVLKNVAKGRTKNVKDSAQITRLNSAIEQMVIKQKAVFVMAVILLGVLLFARMFSN